NSYRIFTVLTLAAVPPLCGFMGTTQIGWQVGFQGTVRLTQQSAGLMAILTYFALLVGFYAIVWLIHWMSITYGDKQPLPRCITLAIYAASPLFLLGLVTLYPLLWLNMILGIPALAYSVYLLYSGLPIMFDTTKERGFLFSTAVLGVGLVSIVTLMAATVVLWGFGFGPEYVAD
ncbi:MAG: Yip1 family protein, partial [Pseudomonadota bacterium]